MIIAIDISQVIFEGSGVARYVFELTRHVIQENKQHQIVLFGYSWGKHRTLITIANLIKDSNKHVHVRIFPFPVRLAEFVWNRVHWFPIEWLLGDIDIYWSSDWVQPPLLRAMGVTTIHDLSTFLFPEQFVKKIVDVHNRKLRRSKKICSLFFCDSIATQMDVVRILEIPQDSTVVIYPGFKELTQ